MKLEFSRQFSKINVQFPENPSHEQRCPMRKAGRTDMMKLIDAFRNVVYEPNNPQDWKNGSPNLPNTKQECHPLDRVVRFNSKTQERKQVDATLRTV